ncbi:MAG: DUF1707 SHOCT-like domain-containing protein [Trebonia sp.]
MRASHADREQVIEVLKAAFVQGRLDKGELDVRVGQAFASRTYAELAALTADIPAARPPRQPARGQNRASRSRPIRNGAIASGVGLSVAVAAVGGAIILDDHAAQALLMLAAFIVLVVVPGVMVAAVAQAWEQRRSRGQLPPRPGQDGRAREVQPPGEADHDPALPGDCPDQTRADLRTHRSRPSRPHSFWRVAQARGALPGSLASA